LIRVGTFPDEILYDTHQTNIALNIIRVFKWMTQGESAKSVKVHSSFTVHHAIATNVTGVITIIQTRNGIHVLHALRRRGIEEKTIRVMTEKEYWEEPTKNIESDLLIN
jgi:hypothetical protein